jgi:hypothetical protein
MQDEVGLVHAIKAYGCRGIITMAYLKFSAAVRIILNAKV